MKNEILKIDKELPTVKKTELPSGHPLNDLTCRMLIAEAIKAREKAYAPYSGFKVGAALMSAGKKIITGCNIENAAYGPSMCAERTAIFKAVSEGVHEFEAICVVGGLEESPSGYSVPCGVCRQVMTEFCEPAFPIIVAKDADHYELYTLQDLLPKSFGPDNLRRNTEE